MPSGNEVVAVGVHEFPEEVLVEVTVRDEDDDLVVHSYQFELLGDDAVDAVESPHDDLEPVVSSALADEGFQYGDESAA